MFIVDIEVGKLKKIDDEEESRDFTASLIFPPFFLFGIKLN